MSIVSSYMVPHPPLIVSEVGEGKESEVLETIHSYEKIAQDIANIKPDTIIISSPHAPLYSDYFYLSSAIKVEGSFENFSAPEVLFSEINDVLLVEKIEELAKIENFPAGRGKETPLDHGVMVPLYFIRKYCRDFKVVVVGLSFLPLIDNYKMGMIISKAVDALDRRAVFVASGDLSHKLQDYGPYGFVKEGPMYDEKIMNIMKNASFDKLISFDSVLMDKASECGHRSFLIMAGALDGKKVLPKMFSHQDVTGVGYGICSYHLKGNDKNRCFYQSYLDSLKKKIKKEEKDSSIYVQLARNTIVEYIKNHSVLEVPDNLPEDILNKQSGVFVSIHKFGSLRGCIGTFLPTTDNIASEIIRNAISAATNDYRFPPIVVDELEWLEINVDVLSEPKPVTNMDILNPKKYGIIVRNEDKSGLLLPDLDGVDTVEEQLRIAKKKAGILDSDEYEIEYFEVTRYN